MQELLFSHLAPALVHRQLQYDDCICLSSFITSPIDTNGHSKEEVLKAIDSMKCNKSPCVYGNTQEMMKKGAKKGSVR